MDGVPRQGTGGQGDYLEHAGGLILATARGVFGIDDTADGVLRWTSRLPARMTGMTCRLWHFGHLWHFGLEGGQYWVDPGGGKGLVEFTRDGNSRRFEVTGRVVLG